MAQKGFLLLLFLFTVYLDLTLSFALNHADQTVLLSSKTVSEPLIIPMRKKQRSVEEQKNLVSFLQTARKSKGKTASFLQTKFGSINEADRAGSTASLPLNNILNTQYSGKVALGSPDNEFDAIWDTGSTALFINSVLCKQDACRNRPQYDIRKSETLDIPRPAMAYQIVYGSGAIHGVIAKEDVYVQDFKMEKYVLLLLAEQAGILEHANFESVIGLSFPQSHREVEIISLFDAMKPQLPQPHFSFRLGRNEEDSYLMFGGYKQEHMDSEIVWHPVIDDTYWMIQLDDISVGGQSTDFCRRNRCGIVVDSGTSVLTAPEEAMDEMEKLIGDVACDNIANLPILSFESNGKKYELEGNDYLVTIDSEYDAEFYRHSEDVYACAGTFTPEDMKTRDGVYIFIFGDVFFTKYYAIFDRGQNRIGLALNKR